MAAVTAAAALSSNSRALWYLTRGFGLVSLVLLTLTTVLGLLQVIRYSRPGWPRFVLSALHKNASLLAVTAIGIHVLTALLDSYAPIHLMDVFVPLASRYRPLWTGLGALAIDLLVALVVTSLLRERIGHRTWRAVHWAAYACWPVAVMHGLGTGSDSKLGWVLLLYALSGAAVVVALWWRLGRGWNSTTALGRGLALAATIFVPVAIAGWTAAGPLHPGWARRAGTPTALLGSGAASAGGRASGGPATGAASSSGAGSASASGSGSASPSGSGSASPSGPPTQGPVRSGGSGLAVPFRDTFSGSQSQSGPDGNGLVSIVISGTISGGAPGSLRLVLTGQPTGDGGVSLTGSQVQMGPTGDPSAYRGHVTQLDGSAVVASLTGRAGNRVTATIELQLHRQDSGVTGTVQAQ